MPKTVLDLGAFNGCASSHLVETGDRWILVDNKQYEQYGWGAPTHPAHSEYHVMDAMEWQEPADVVVCSNVLYHVPDPKAFLKHLRKLTKGTLHLRTYYDPPGTDDWNYYYDKRSGHGQKATDLTIWYRPTRVGLEKGLSEAGFTKVEIKMEAGELVAVCS